MFPEAALLRSYVLKHFRESLICNFIKIFFSGCCSSLFLRGFSKVELQAEVHGAWCWHSFQKIVREMVITWTLWSTYSISASSVSLHLHLHVFWVVIDEQDVDIIGLGDAKNYLKADRWNKCKLTVRYLLMTWKGLPQNTEFHILRCLFF